MTYGYLANSPLFETVTFKQGGTTRLTATKSFDNLNRLTQIASVPSADATVSFNYQYNSANQRTAVTNAGNSRWAYSYDSLGQVTSGKKYWSDSTPATGQQFEYAFDDIGNRKSMGSGGDAFGANLRYANYTVDSLNRYTNRTVPGYVNVLGEATNTATVTLWSSSGSYSDTSRKSNYYRGELLETNTLGLWLTLTNLAVLNNGTNADIVTNITGNVFLPKTPEAYTYDSDGNLTSDGRWTNSWDAENRLIQIESLADAPSGSKRKLTFAYDHLGRRTEAWLYVWNGSAYALNKKRYFVYDAWNLIAALGHELALMESFVWGWT